MTTADQELFNKAEADLQLLGSRLQLTHQEVITVYLLVVAKDLEVTLPAAFQGLTTNYAAFLNPASGSFNDEKRAIYDYIGRVGTDLVTFQYVLLNLIAKKRAIASIQSVIPADTLPPAPYIPPLPKKPPSSGVPLPNNPPSVSVPVVPTSLESGTTAQISVGAIDNDGIIASIQFRVNGVNFGSPITALPFQINWTPAAGIYSITAVATDDDGATATSNAVVVTVTDPEPNPGGGAFSSAFSSAFS